MSGYQRMVAIPQEEYLQLTTLQNTKNPLYQHMSQLTQEHEQIPSSSYNPYDQLMLQGGVMEEMKRVKEKIRDDIALGMPKPYRNRAATLYRSIEPYIQISKLGEISDDKGHVLKDSRIEDLIGHAVRDRRRHFTPTAWSAFVEILKRYNIPKSTLNRLTLDEIEGIKAKPMKKVMSSKIPIAIRTSKRKRRPSTRYPDHTFLTKF